MDRKIEEALDLCIDKLAEGRSIEETLELFPEFAEELEPLLKTAAAFRNAPRAEPSPGALDALLVKAGAELPRRGMRIAGSGKNGSDAPRRRSSFLPAVFRWGGSIAATLLLAFGLSTVSVWSSPGDFFYPLKLATKKVAFAVTSDPGRRAELRLSFTDDQLDQLVREARKTGEIDPKLLKRLLGEAEFALKDTGKMPEAQTRLFLAKLGYYNAYEKTVLSHLKGSVRNKGADASELDRAISACDERERWIENMQKTPEGAMPANRSWGPGCSCD